MYSGISLQQPEEELKQDIEPVSQDPQPKQKSEGPGKLISEMLQLLSFSEQLRVQSCLLYTSPSPRDRTRSRMPSSA